MRLQKISIFYLVAFFALLSSIGNILSGENSLDLYDSHARFYDSMIGRTTSQDPLAEKYSGVSPYLWCAANPIKFGDKNGMYLKGIDGNPVFYLRNKYVRDQAFNGSGFLGVYGAAASIGYSLGYLIEDVGQWLTNDPDFRIRINPYTKDFTPIEKTLQEYDRLGITIY